MSKGKENKEKTKAEKTNKQTGSENEYVVTEEGKEATLKILENLSYNQAAPFVNILQKGKLKESEVNEILQFMGNLPFKNVVKYFNNVKTYFVLNKE